MPSVRNAKYFCRIIFFAVVFEWPIKIDLYRVRFVVGRS